MMVNYNHDDDDNKDGDADSENLVCFCWILCDEIVIVTCNMSVVCMVCRKIYSI